MGKYCNVLFNQVWHCYLDFGLTGQLYLDGQVYPKGPYVLQKIKRASVKVIGNRAIRYAIGLCHLFVVFHHKYVSTLCLAPFPTYNRLLYFKRLCGHVTTPT